MHGAARDQGPDGKSDEQAERSRWQPGVAVDAQEPELDAVSAAADLGSDERVLRGHRSRLMRPPSGAPAAGR